MSIQHSVTSAVIAASLIAGSALPLATAVQADGWVDRGGRQDYRHHDRGDWNVDRDRRYRGFETYRNGPRNYRDDRAERREDKKEKKIARGIAIGVLMLGAILSQAGNHNHR